jgi:hypothetical protein
MNDNIEYETITRKDGITYQRKKRNNNFDCHLNIKYFKYKIDKLKSIADKKNVKYNAMIRDLLEEFIQKEGF